MPAADGEEANVRQGRKGSMACKSMSDEGKADIGAVALYHEWEDAVDGYMRGEEGSKDVARRANVAEVRPYPECRDRRRIFAC